MLPVFDPFMRGLGTGRFRPFSQRTRAGQTRHVYVINKPTNKTVYRLTQKYDREILQIVLNAQLLTRQIEACNAHFLDLTQSAHKQ